MNTWISVKEGLPKINRLGLRSNSVLLVLHRKCDTRDSFGKEQFISTGYLCAGEDDIVFNWELDDPIGYLSDPESLTDLINVTHWMPLPRLPKEDENLSGIDLGED